MEIRVYGTPAPQGSKRFMGVRGGKGVMVESSKAVKPWREAVKHAVLDLREKDGGRFMVDGPVEIDIIFTMPKPKSAPKIRRTWPDRKPDIDKTCRSTLDALVAVGAIEDDARVVRLLALKVFPNEHPLSLHVPGAVIEIRNAQ